MKTDCSIEDWRDAAKDEISEHDEKEAKQHIYEAVGRLIIGDIEQCVDSLLMAASYLTENVQHESRTVEERLSDIEHSINSQQSEGNQNNVVTNADGVPW